MHKDLSTSSTSDDFTGIAVLTDLLNQCTELWHAPDGRTFATVYVGEARRSFPIEGSEFALWLRGEYFNRYGRTPKAFAIGDAVAQADAMARFTGPEHPFFLRVGECAGKLYLDLADDVGRVVEIDESGWKVLINPEVRFVRSAGMHPLPEPERDGSLTELKDFLNVQDDGFVLVASYLVGALRPSGPFVILFIQGEQGSAKSTTARVLRRLIDPAEPIDKTKPRSVQDLFIDADKNWVLVYDNISTIPGDIADAFCRIATGGGFSTRKLYSGRDQETFSASRPQILNGIDDLAVRDDLRDRGLLIELPVIDDGHRRSEDGFWDDFLKARPRILGALLDAVSAGLRNIDSVELPRTPRMADFARWVSASEEALPWEEGVFLEAYERNRGQALQVSLDHEPLAKVIVDFAEAEQDWVGTPTKLLRCLDLTTALADRTLPRDASQLSKRLRRIQTALRAIGVEVSQKRGSDAKRTRMWSVRAVRPVQQERDGPPEDGRKAGTVAIPVEVVDGLGPVG